MVKFVFCVALFLVAGMTQVFSQEDSTVYRNGLPISEDDTVRQFLQSDLEPKNKLTEVPPNALPSDLLDVLNKEEQYQGWQDSTVYFESNTGLYLVPVRTEDGVRIYGLNENGKPVTFDEVDRPRQ